jgi:hypothetical protein
LGGDSVAGDDAVNVVEDGSEGARHRSRRGYVPRLAITCRVGSKSKKKLMPHIKCHVPPPTTKTRLASATNDNCNKNIAARTARISVRDSV